MSRPWPAVCALLLAITPVFADDKPKTEDKPKAGSSKLESTSRLPR